jgi:hypothetical protein
LQHAPQGVAFAKEYGAPHDSAVANTMVFEVDGFENDSDFLNYIAEQKEKQDDASRFKILSMNKQQVAFKNTSCLKYYSVSEDHGPRGIDSPDFQYLKSYGYVCRHPIDKRGAYQMEVSHRSNNQDFPPALQTAADNFFSNIQLNNNGW